MRQQRVEGALRLGTRLLDHAGAEVGAAAAQRPAVAADDHRDVAAAGLQHAARGGEVLGLE